MKNHRITWVCVHGIDLALCLVLNCVGSGMGRSVIESHSVKKNGKRIVSGVSSRG